MKHYIIVKWNELVQDKKAMLEMVKDTFKDVVYIDGVNNVEVFENNSDRANRFDVMIKIECSKEGLEKYDVSDLHKNWKIKADKYLLNKAIFDCD